MKAMILAAGLGTRLQEYTKNKPKALVEVEGKPLIAHILEKLARAGYTTVVVNVHHFAQQITDYLSSNNFGVKIQISDETSALLDTGGGIQHAKTFLDGNEPFLVHNVDIISDIDIGMMMRKHIQSNALVTLAVGNRQSSRKLLFDPHLQLAGWKNVITHETIIPDESKGNLTEYAFGGIHIMNPQIFNKIKAKGSFSIIDTYLTLCPTEKIIGFDTSNNFVIDVGKVQNLKEAADFLRRS
jgi:NDP-sugar pyrophosphorylase family protein